MKNCITKLLLQDALLKSDYLCKVFSLDLVQVVLPSLMKKFRLHTLFTESNNLTTKIERKKATAHTILSKNLPTS